MEEIHAYQPVPIRVYQTDTRIMLAAPMPGLEPENISVSVAGKTVTIRGELRGPRQDERDLLVAEWTIGPYYRQVTLPQPVSGDLTNATYGNGVLVLSMPKVGPGREDIPAAFTLEPLPIDSTRGERIGHEGLEVYPTTTERDRQEREQTARSAGEG